jgi:hypothetical protein
MMARADSPEFARPLPLDAIGSDDEVRRTISASAAERAALARRFGLQALEAFDATLTVARAPADEILTHGHIVADVVQTCVVTLEPVPAHVDERFDVRFTTRAEVEPGARDIGPEDEEPAEPLGGDVLDIGELAAQQLALALDPWPRLPGAKLPDELVGDTPRDGPFTALARWRAKAAGNEK